MNMTQEQQCKQEIGLSSQRFLVPSLRVGMTESDVIISDPLAELLVRYKSVAVGWERCLERQLSVSGFSSSSGSCMKRCLCAASPHKNPDHIVKIKFSEILFMLFFSVWTSSTAQWHWQSAYPCSYNCVHFWAVFRFSVIPALYNLERLLFCSLWAGVRITTAVKRCTADEEEFASVVWVNATQNCVVFSFSNHCTCRSSPRWPLRLQLLMKWMATIRSQFCTFHMCWHNKDISQTCIV